MTIPPGRRSRRGSTRHGPRRWRSCGPHRPGTPRRSIACRYSSSTANGALDRLGQALPRVDPLAEPGDAHEPLHRDELRRRPARRRRRGGGWSWCRCRWRRRAPSRRPRPAGRRPSGRRDRRRPRGTRRSGRGGTSRPGGCRPRLRSVGARGAPVGWRRRAHGRSGRAPRRCSPARPPPRPPTPPSLSSRATATRSTWPTSQ